jgi:DNA-binding NarL/FixJ family response regulator
MSTKTKPTVIVAEDSRIYLERIAKLVAKDFEILAVTTDGNRGLAATMRSSPDVVLLDIALPGISGIEIAREIRRSGQKSKIVFVTVHEGADFMQGAVQAGADGYVFKSRLDTDLLRALDEVLAGRVFLSSNSAE